MKVYYSTELFKKLKKRAHQGDKLLFNALGSRLKWCRSLIFLRFYFVKAYYLLTIK